MRAQPLPTPARPTRGRTTGRAPDAAHPALPRGPRGRGCKAGRRPNLTYDREPGAGAEELLIGAQRPRPARKPAGAAAAALVPRAPSARARRGAGDPMRACGGALSRRLPSRPVAEPRGHSPSTASRLPAPKVRTAEAEHSPGAPHRNPGRAARAAHPAPAAACRSRSTASPRHGPRAPHKNPRGVSPLTQHRQPGARAEILLVCAHSTEARDKNSAAAPDSARPPATLDAPSLLPRPEPGVPGPGAARL